MKDVYLVKIQDFAAVDLREAVKSEIISIVRDFGQSIDPADASYLVDRTIEILIKKHRFWDFGDFRNAMQRGKLGMCQGAVFTKISVRAVEIWLWHHNEYRMKKAAEETERTAQHMKREKWQPHPDNEHYASAMQWKISNRQELKGRWDDFPVTMVMNHFKNKTVHELNRLLHK